MSALAASSRLGQPAASIQRIGPWTALAIAVAFSIWLPLPPTRSAEVDKRHQNIKAVFEAVPLRLGDWVGEESPLTPAAVELLRPNAAICRTFRRLGVQENFKFSLIHCSDFRDMGGHYPPVCYPAHGWTLESGIAPGENGWTSAAGEVMASEDPRTSLSVTIPGGDQSRELVIYRFSRSGAAFREAQMTVLSAFILPDGRWTGSLREIRDSASRRRITSEGVAQVQVALAGWPALDSIEDSIRALLGSIPEQVWRSMVSIPNSTEAGFK